MKFQFYFTVFKLAIIVLVPITLMILPADFFDHGQTVCASQIFFGIECPACGLTRGCMHLIHFEAEEAFAYNIWSFVALPAISLYWLFWGIKEFKRFTKMRRRLLTAPQV
ncbi:MAG: DUF2752 domain-containing protein [Pseudobacter sp.]|uniref:DUF2752 domain-containing protein n=1 Tax=Pseudobacter sp. TaxID=2045420 RepID=UPI003F80336D